MLRADGLILVANPVAEKMFGFLPGMLVGVNADVLVPKYNAEDYLAFKKRFAESPTETVMEEQNYFFARRKDFTVFPLVVHIKPLQDSAGLRVILYLQDISRRHREEEVFLIQKAQLEQVNARLELAVKERTLGLQKAVEELNATKEELHKSLMLEKDLNDLKSRFVSMASHEFRTPLATILSSISLVTQYVEQCDRERMVKHIARIKAAIETLTDILDNVLSISKMDEGRIEVQASAFNFPELAASVIEGLQASAGSEVMIDYKHIGDRDVVLDPRLIKHILMNLGSNAIKFSGESKTIRIQSQIASDRLQITVSDNGIGIAPEDQKHLFGRFFRAQNAINIQGTGLGLNIVATYVNMLRGNISCISKLNSGTTFNINMPQQYQYE